jgi:hypothetical protein
LAYAIPYVGLRTTDGGDARALSRCGLESLVAVVRQPELNDAEDEEDEKGQDESELNCRGAAFTAECRVD